MPHFLNTAQADFTARFATLLSLKREVSEDVDAQVRAIIDDVRVRGDAALIELTHKFDQLLPTPATLRVPVAKLDAALEATPPDVVAALKFAYARIKAFHERQLPRDDAVTDQTGTMMGTRWTSVSSVGLYVPGGLAAYPSSVLMSAVPAKVAGVPRIAMVMPAKAGVVNPLVLAAATVAGVDEVYTVGGAQAIAALAFGTASIKAVDKIVGPGNAYVAAAKRQVFGHVGIDSIAGPSEVLIIADGDNNPAWIAADLLAQAEHDTAAQSILLTDSQVLADAVGSEVTRQLATLPRAQIARASWESFGAIIVLKSLDEAPALADQIAAEHLEIATAYPEALAGKIRHAGAIFLGAFTPEAIGDYVGGPNHVLPTARTARFSSGLGVLDFLKRTTLLKLDAAALSALSEAAMTLAHVEGLDAHRRSIAIRLARPPEGTLKA